MKRGVTTSTRSAVQSRSLLLFFLILAFISSTKVIQCQTFTLDVFEQPQDSTEFVVDSTGQVAVNIVMKSASNNPLYADLRLTQFTSDNVPPGDVTIKLPNEPEENWKQERSKVKLSPGNNTIYLVASLPTLQNYVGMLRLSPTSGDTISWKILLRRLGSFKPAEILLSKHTINLTVQNPFIQGVNDNPAFYLTLSEKENRWALEGITLGIVEVSTAPESGFTIDNMMVFINGNTVTNFSAWPPRNNDEYSKQLLIRRIPEDGTAQLKVALKNLDPGSYNVKLRIKAANTKEAAEQIVTLNLTVRSNIWWAIIVLIGAIIISFISTKWVEVLRSKYNLKKQIYDLNYNWLKSEPSYAAVIWVRSTIRQCRSILNKIWIGTPDIIQEKIDQAKEMIEILESVRLTRDQIENCHENSLIKKRLRQEFNDIISLLKAEPVSKPVKDEFEKRLTEFNKLLDKKQFINEYWNILRREMEILIQEINVEKNTEENTEGNTEQEKTKKTKKDLETLTKTEIVHNQITVMVNKMKEMVKATPGRVKIVAYEKYYSKLKILWLIRNSVDDFPNFNKTNDESFLEDCFLVFDEDLWELITGKNKTSKIWIENPLQDGPEFNEAFQPIQFKVKTDNSIVNESFLFTRGIRYEWELKLKKRLWLRITSWLKGPFSYKTRTKAEKLTPISNEPNVVQFAPWPGKVIASVNLYWEDKKLLNVTTSGKPASAPAPEIIKTKDQDTALNPPPPTEETKTTENDVEENTKESKAVEIGRSKTFNFLRSFNSAEVIAFVFIIIFATITGLQAVYYSTDGFGSCNDFITLFLWGAGLDQTKNALKIVRDYNAQKKQDQPA